MEKYRFNDIEKNALEKLRTPLAVYQFIDNHVTSLVLSDGFCDLFDYDDRDDAHFDMDNDMYKYVHPDDSARISEAALRFATNSSPSAKYEVVYRSKTKKCDGYSIIHAFGEHVVTDTGVRLAYVWYTYEGKYSEENSSGGGELTASLNKALHDGSLIKASHYDELSGLPNMTYFFELVTTNKDFENPVLLFFDFCRMKYFNHTYGFAEGDRLIRAFARLLARYFGNENCSRFGQDHFAIITEDRNLRGILKDLFEETRWINGGLSLPVHVGIYQQSMETVRASTACDRAKLACDSLKGIYSSSFCYFSESMSEAIMNRQYILANLNRALSEKWIKVYYQPIVRALNGSVCDEEALARWIDPVKGFMSPADFIPTLEDSGLIYKLDLYVVEQVLEKLRIQQKAGLHLVPQSVNLSRSDFDACDIVEEIRMRVDASGFSRSLITIEITESVIGSDFEFMKEKIDKFRELGFAVWMDDFGSGYSSLDVLQSVKFDLIKFDMRFLQHFDDKASGKIILSELIKMATTLGIDTVCEGVETEAQMRFLRETGCSKLQGYYFCKPIPVTQILERYEKGIQIGFENPEESKYFETIGRINLNDLSIITCDSGSTFDKFFDSLPMAVIELNGEDVRVARSNRSYRDFIRRFFDRAPGSESRDFYSETAQHSMPILMNIVRQCCDNDSRSFVDIKTPDNSTVHYFVRRVAANPLNGKRAAVVVVLSIIDPGQTDASYANIARALAADYFNLFYVDLETEDFIEYSSSTGKEEMAVERHGKNFFFEARKDALQYLYHEDRAAFVLTFTKEKVLHAIDVQGTFTLTYRLLTDKEPVYVNMKAVRMQDNGKHIIIGVSNIDAQMKQKELLVRTQRDRLVYDRLMALSGNYICMYTVNPHTGSYYEYSSTSDYEGLGFDKSGDNFFARALIDGKTNILPDEYIKYSKLFTKENVLNEIKKTGMFKIQYHLVMNEEPQLVQLKAVLINESDGEKLLVGVSRQ